MYTCLSCFSLPFLKISSNFSEMGDWYETGFMLFLKFQAWLVHALAKKCMRTNEWNLITNLEQYVIKIACIQHQTTDEHY